MRCLLGYQRRSEQPQAPQFKLVKIQYRALFFRHSTKNTSLLGNDCDRFPIFVQGDPENPAGGAVRTAAYLRQPAIYPDHWRRRRWRGADAPGFHPAAAQPAEYGPVDAAYQSVFSHSVCSRSFVCGKRDDGDACGRLQPPLRDGQCPAAGSADSSRRRIQYRLDRPPGQGARVSGDRRVQGRSWHLLPAGRPFHGARQGAPGCLHPGSERQGIRVAEDLRATACRREFAPFRGGGQRGTGDRRQQWPAMADSEGRFPL